MPVMPASVSISMMFRRKYGPWQPLAARMGGSGRATGVTLSPVMVSRDSRRRSLDALRQLNEFEAKTFGDPETVTRIEQYELAYRMQASVPETFDISAFLGELRQGDNLLAIQGVNQAIDSSDFSLIPELATAGSAANGLGCGDILYATAATVGLSGRADACTTHSVRLNGQPAAYDAFRGRWSGSVTVGPGDNPVTIEAFDGAGGLLETREIIVRRLAGAFTPVSGTLAGNTVWRPQDGPYLMTANVVIPAGSSLTIQAGTVVLGQSGASIIVRGRITADGTEAQPIIFRAAGCENRWGGIGIEGTGTGAANPTHVLRYCDFEFGDLPAGFEGNVAPVGSKLLVDHCKFKFITANAVDGTDARVEVMA